MGPVVLDTLPIAVFPGKVHLVESEASALRARLLIGRARVVGLDTESRPSFRKGESFPISLVQVATERHALLFRVRPGKPYRFLKRLIEDPGITKVVQGAPEETRELRRDLGVEARGFVDLPTVAREAGYRTLNLRGLAADVLGVHISKGAQRSDWSRTDLSRQQIVYAATDAWAALAVYTRIRQGDRGVRRKTVDPSHPVRPARVADAQAVADLVRELARSTRETSAVDASLVRRWMGTPGCGTLVTESSGQVVGVLTYTVRPNLYHAGPVCLIEELVVHPKARGKGIGRSLLQAAVQAARGRGCAEISVSTGTDNKTALALYRDAGFADEAVLLEHHFPK